MTNVDMINSKSAIANASSLFLGTILLCFWECACA